MTGYNVITSPVVTGLQREERVDFRLLWKRIYTVLMEWEVRVVRLSQFLADLNRKAGLLLECNDILIDGAVNEMFGWFVSCRPGFGRSD